MSGALDRPIGKGWLIAGGLALALYVLYQSSSSSDLGNLNGVPRDWPDLGGGGGTGGGDIFAAITRATDVSRGAPGAPPVIGSGGYGAAPSSSLVAALNARPAAAVSASATRLNYNAPSASGYRGQTGSGLYSKLYTATQSATPLAPQYGGGSAFGKNPG